MTNNSLYLNSKSSSYIIYKTARLLIEHSRSLRQSFAFFTDDNEEVEGGKPFLIWPQKNSLVQTKKFLHWQNVLYDVQSVVYETKV